MANRTRTITAKNINGDLMLCEGTKVYLIKLLTAVFKMEEDAETKR